MAFQQDVDTMTCSNNQRTTNSLLNRLFACNDEFLEAQYRESRAEASHECQLVFAPEFLYSQPRLLKHVLQSGSRSCFGGDEDWSEFPAPH